MKHILWIGHSVLDYCDFESIGDYQVTNWGVAGSIAQEGVQALAQRQVNPDTYDLVLVMYGVNELLQGRSIDSVLHYLPQVTDWVQEQIPEAPIILADVMHADSEATLQTRRIDRLNEGLADLRQKAGFYSLDWENFYDDQGYVLSEYSYDGVHLTPAGYDLFKENLQALIDQIQESNQ